MDTGFSRLLKHQYHFKHNVSYLQTLSRINLKKQSYETHESYYHCTFCPKPNQNDLQYDIVYIIFP